MGIDSELLVTTVNNEGETPANYAAVFGNTEALKIILDFNPKCLLVPADDGYLPIHIALMCSAIKTFFYLFKQMKSSKVEYDIFLKAYGLKLLRLVIETGLIGMYAF